MLYDNFYFWFYSYSYLVPLPERDDDGRKVILSCAGKFDPYKHSSTEMARVHSLVVESLMDDPENQIRGKLYFIGTLFVELQMKY